MKKALLIAAREVRSAFTTPLFYVLVAAFTLLTGFFFFGLVRQFNSVLQQAGLVPDVQTSLNIIVIGPLFETLVVVLLFLVPLLTMRSIAEEKKSGTFELLMTAPLAFSDLIFGKFLGIAFVLLIAILFAGVYPAILIATSNPEVLPIFTGLLGLYLFVLALVALGIAVSSGTDNQAVAGIVTFVLFLLFYVADSASESAGSFLGAFLTYLAPREHVLRMIKGVVSSSDLLYFLSLIFLGLFAANRVLDYERWRG